MSSLYADANYSFNPWMRDIQPQMRPDDGAADVLEQEQLIEELTSQVPPPPDAGYTPRMLGYVREEPGIADVLNIGPETLMQDTETKQESGQPGYGGPAFGKW